MNSLFQVPRALKRYQCKFSTAVGMKQEFPFIPNATISASLFNNAKLVCGSVKFDAPSVNVLQTVNTGWSDYIQILSIDGFSAHAVHDELNIQVTNGTFEAARAVNDSRLADTTITMPHMANFNVNGLGSFQASGKIEGNVAVDVIGSIAVDQVRSVPWSPRVFNAYKIQGGMRCAEMHRAFECFKKSGRLH